MTTATKPVTTDALRAKSGKCAASSAPQHDFQRSKRGFSDPGPLGDQRRLWDAVCPNCFSPVGQRRQCSGFILFHEPAVADHVSSHYSCKAALVRSSAMNDSSRGSKANVSMSLDDARV
jgi:hypothetical protein